MISSPYTPSQISGGVIDVSHYDNGGSPIHWDGVVSASSTLRAVIAKATQGISEIDSQWAANRRGIPAAKLLLGAYHFCTSDDPDTQVDHFLSTVGGTKGVLLALDWEAPDPDNPTFTAATVSQVERMAVRIHSRVGRPVLIYAGRSMLEEPSAILSAYPLWLAEYGSDPICPPGWDKWTLHQFTDNEMVAGINGPVDASMHDDTQGSLADLWYELAEAAPGSITPTPTPLPPVPAPAAAPTALAVITALQDPNFVKSIQELVGAEPVDGILGPETIGKIDAFRAT